MPAITEAEAEAEAKAAAAVYDRPALDSFASTAAQKCSGASWPAYATEALWRSRSAAPPRLREFMRVVRFDSMT
jgi:hypothetical protein